MLTSEELTLWCHKLLYCDNYEDLRRPFDIDMMKVNRTISEFNQMNDYEKSQVLAYAIGNLTDYRRRLFGRSKPPEGYLPKQVVKMVRCEMCKIDVESQEFARHTYILHTVK